MQPTMKTVSSPGQWLAFEIGSAQYALPIDSILEIEGPGRQARCVPGLPMDSVAVMNWHGSALPVVSSHLLFSSEAERDTVERKALPVRSTRWSEAHILVISEPDGEMPRLGLPVERILGLLDVPPSDGMPGQADDGEAEGRSASPLGLCPHELWNRAACLVERACA
ncbi:chemotaxis protein CheW [Myxococcota bacterium]|nr:chemotaxis protein CheW [Myxococcota bacterium]